MYRIFTILDGLHSLHSFITQALEVWMLGTPDPGD